MGHFWAPLGKNGALVCFIQFLFISKAQVRLPHVAAPRRALPQPMPLVQSITTRPLLSPSWGQGKKTTWSLKSTQNVPPTPQEHLPLTEQAETQKATSSPPRGLWRIVRHLSAFSSRRCQHLYLEHGRHRLPQHCRIPGLIPHMVPCCPSALAPPNSVTRIDAQADSDRSNRPLTDGWKGTGNPQKWTGDVHASRDLPRGCTKYGLSPNTKMRDARCGLE